MPNQRSERETLRKWSTFSLVLVVAGHLEWGSSVTSSWPSSNILCHLLQYDLEKQSSLRASRSNSNAWVAFFLSFPQNLIVCHSSSKRFIPLCYKVKKKHITRRHVFPTHIARSELVTSCMGRADSWQHCLTNFTVPPCTVTSEQNHTHYLYDGPCTCTWYMANKTAGVITELRTKGLSFHNLKCHTDASGERQSPLYSKTCSGQLQKP